MAKYLTLLLALLILTACAPAPAPKTITVFAAASLVDAFTEAGKAFESAHPGTKVVFNFAGSQTLSTQLMQGASADIFASANRAEMDKLIAGGLVEGSAPQDFVTNKLVVIVPADNPAGIRSPQDLALPNVKLVLADETVPAGKYARSILESMQQDAAFGNDFKARVLENVVSNETDVRQVVAKVQLGEADAGMAYISDAIVSPKLKMIGIPDEFNVVAKYPIAMLKNAQDPDMATEFIKYLFSEEGQAILKKSGFTPSTRQ